MKTHTDSFLDSIMDPKQTIFLCFWAMKEEVQILKDEIQVVREGVPKGMQYPMPRNKRLLALALAVSEFKLKDFAEKTGTSYAVIRVWAREKKVMEMVKEYQLFFALAFLDEIETRMKAMEGGLEAFQYHSGAISGLFREFAHYVDPLQFFIIEIARNNEDWVWQFNAYMLVRSVSGLSIYRTPRNLKEKQKLEDMVKGDGEIRERLLDSMISSMKEDVEKGNLDNTNFQFDLLKKFVLGLAEENTDLKLRVLKKGERVRRDGT